MALEDSAGEGGPPCLEGLRCHPDQNSGLYFSKAQKFLSERVPRDQKSVSEHCRVQKGLQGQVGAGE